MPARALKRASLTPDGLVVTAELYGGLADMEGDLDDIANGTNFHRVQSAALSAAGLVLLDEVIEGTYGLVASSDLTAHHLLMTAIVGDLDDIDEGTLYGKPLVTCLQAGQLKLTSNRVLFIVEGNIKETNIKLQRVVGQINERVLLRRRLLEEIDGFDTEARRLEGELLCHL